mgnify:CR=1 FL=1
MLIEASGPVGMLIRVEALEYMEYPYYKIDHIGTKEDPTKMIGGDVYFSKKLKQLGIQMFLDPKVTFPHNTSAFVNRGKVVF